MSSRSLNKVLLIGNLTRDPECRYTPNQALVCSFGLATNREWASDSGERQTSVEYHNLVVWSRLAEICKSLLHKGNKVYVEGRLQTRDWQTKDGQQRRTTEIIVENMILLTPKSAETGGSEMGGGVSAPSERETLEQETPLDKPEETGGAEVMDEGDIPF